MCLDQYTTRMTQFSGGQFPSEKGDIPSENMFPTEFRRKFSAGKIFVGKTDFSDGNSVGKLFPTEYNLFPTEYNVVDQLLLPTENSVGKFVLPGGIFRRKS